MTGSRRLAGARVLVAGARRLRRRRSPACCSRCGADGRGRRRRPARSSPRSTAAGCGSTAGLTRGPGRRDLVVTSPGWRPDHPLLAAAPAAGVEVVGEPELAWRLRAGAVPAGPPRGSRSPAPTARPRRRRCSTRSCRRRAAHASPRATSACRCVDAVRGRRPTTCSPSSCPASSCTGRATRAARRPPRAQRRRRPPRLARLVAAYAAAKARDLRGAGGSRSPTPDDRGGRALLRGRAARRRGRRSPCGEPGRAASSGVRRRSCWSTGPSRRPGRRRRRARRAGRPAGARPAQRGQRPRRRGARPRARRPGRRPSPRGCAASAPGAHRNALVGRARTASTGSTTARPPTRTPRRRRWPRYPPRRVDRRRAAQGAPTSTTLVAAVHRGWPAWCCWAATAP